MRPLAEAGAALIAETWNAVSGEKYAVDDELIHLNLLDSSLLHERASWWSEGQFLAIKRNASSLYSGPEPSVAHLSLFSPSLSDELWQRTLVVLREEGVRAIVVGTDSNHFLPGAPLELPWTVATVEALGFAPGGEAVDLERDMTTYVFELGRDGIALRPVEERDRATLDAFLRREFPGRWHYDVMRKIDAEGVGCVVGLFLDDQCEGFALLQTEGCRLPIGGGVWRESLGNHWGTLGPIGISKPLRGRGLGNRLLGGALDELRRRGTHRAIIDWTGLVDFYVAHGFRVTRRYRSYRLEI